MEVWPASFPPAARPVTRSRTLASSVLLLILLPLRYPRVVAG
jgi:hypothetical protein